MILFTILLLIALMLSVIAIAFLSIGGTIGFLLFGDIIVCIVFIVWLMKKRIKKK